MPTGPDTTANYGPADSSFETTQRQASTNLVPRFSGSELALVAEAIPTDHYDSLQLRYDLKWRWRIWTLGKNRVSPQLMDLFRPESQDWSGPKEFFSATEETSWVSTIDTEKGYRVDVSLRDENGDEIAGLSPNFKVEGQKVAGVPVIRK